MGLLFAYRRRSVVSLRCILIVINILSSHLVSSAHLRPSVPYDGGGGRAVRRTAPKEAPMDKSNRSVERVVKSRPREIAEERNKRDYCENVTAQPVNVKQKKMYVSAPPGHRPFSCCGCNRNERLVNDCIPDVPWTRTCTPCGQGEYMDKDAHNERQCKKYPKTPRPNEATQANSTSNITKVGVFGVGNATSTSVKSSTPSLHTGLASAPMNDLSTTSDSKHVGLEFGEPISLKIVMTVLGIVIFVNIVLGAIFCKQLQNIYKRWQKFMNNSEPTNDSFNAQKSDSVRDKRDNRLEEVLISSSADFAEERVAKRQQEIVDGGMEGLGDSLTPLCPEAGNEPRTRSSSSLRHSICTLSKLLKRFSDASSRHSSFVDDDVVPSSKYTPSNQSFAKKAFEKSVNSPSAPLPFSTGESSAHESISFSSLVKSSPSSKKQPKKFNHCPLPTKRNSRKYLTAQDDELTSTVTSKSSASSKQLKILNIHEGPSTTIVDRKESPDKRCSTTLLPKTEGEKITCCANFVRTTGELEVLSGDRIAFGKEFNIPPPRYPFGATENEKFAILIEDGFKCSKCVTKDLVNFIKEKDLKYIREKLLAALDSEGCLIY